jgi:choline dehydrogenase-like flavoprotein
MPLLLKGGVMDSERYDVIIIGTGAGGATLACHLSSSGKKILILERGGFLPREHDNWDTKAVFTDGKYKAKESWLDRYGNEFHPGIHYFVGGNTKVYGAALLRFRKEDFSEIRHHGGVSPAWPISYDDLEPYYEKAEKLYHVHGEAGIDPTEPHRSGAFPYPPLKHEPRIQHLFDDFIKCGHNPFPLPIGVRLGEDIPYPHAEYKMGLFDGFPDPTESKADAHVIAINPILNGNNVTLKINSYVEKLVTDSSGREVTEVHVDENGEKIIYSGNIVVVSGGAINSAALLLRSLNDKHPGGLANSSDMVGRNYMCHNNSAMLAVSKEPNPTLFGKTFAVNDYYFGSNDWDYPLGHIQMLGKSNAEMLKGDAPGFAPGMALDYMAKHSIDFWMTSEDLPDPDNRVMLSKDGQICLHYKDNNLEGHKRLQAKLKGMLKHLGCKKEHLYTRHVYLGKKIPLAGTAHQSGTVRFGINPKTSVLDVNCKAHDLENLYVVDGSFFVSSTAVNPGLTIMANAMRVGDHILKKI